MKIKELLEYTVLDERKTADLYHATDFKNLPDIIRSGALIPGRNQYVSLTRDKRLNYGRDIVREMVVFIIDQAKLAYNKKIEPFDWHQSSEQDPEWMARDPDEYRRAESEERVKGPISLKYVKGVILPKRLAGKKINLVSTLKNMGITVSFMK